MTYTYNNTIPDPENEILKARNGSRLKSQIATVAGVINNNVEYALQRLDTKGQANGFAELDSNGVVPLSQIPESLKNITFKVVADIAARNAASQDAQVDTLYLVSDATGDNTVNAGGALYAYDKLDNTFAKIAEYESLDIDTGVFFNKNDDTTDDIIEGSTNQFFTEGRARSAAVVNSMDNNETDQAPSVDSVKTYIDNLSLAKKATVISSNSTISAAEYNRVFCDNNSNTTITITLSNMNDGDYVDIAIQNDNANVIVANANGGNALDYSCCIVQIGGSLLVKY